MTSPKPRFYCSLFACALLLVATGDFSEAAIITISIDATGDWSETIDASDLQAGAGSDLKSTYESAAGTGLLTISGTSGNGDTWRVDVQRSDTTWHTNFFTLSVKRTGDGSGGGSISGGTVYQVIGESNVEFFSGTGDRSGIPLQFKLEGMSLQVPPGIYSTTVTYTVSTVSPP